MRSSLPRLVRGRPAPTSTTKSATRAEQVRPSVPARSREKAASASQGDGSKPIYTRFIPEDEQSLAKPSSLLEAEFHAKASLPSATFRNNVDRVRYGSRPLPRVVPAGTAMHLPNEHTVFPRKDKTLGPRKLEKAQRESTRLKPAFRKAQTTNLETTSLYEYYSQSVQTGSVKSSSKSAEVSSLSTSGSRRSYTTLPSPVASTSNVRIEDMDAFEMCTKMPSSMNQMKFQPIVPTITRDDGDSNPDGQLAGPTEDAVKGSVMETDNSNSTDVPEPAGSYVVRLPDPESPAQMVGFIKHAARSLVTTSNLHRIYDWHRRFPELQTTASFNILLQLAYKTRNLKAVNQIYMYDMPAAGIARDNVTWDILMETWARNGRWDKVVDVWTQRRDAGMPLNRIGWTRVAQAATKKGTTSLSSSDVKRSMSPIYSALYDLPKGVRQLQLHKMMKAQKMDVDQMLALMMPEDLHPLDYHAALVIAHRLVKQTRWREAEDVVALWLDRTEDTWAAYESETLPQQQEQHQLGGVIGEKADAQAAQYLMAVNAATAKRRQQARGLLHVLLEGLVISRNSPEVVQAYIDNFLARYERTGVFPTYHTLFFVMTAFRVRPMKTRFVEAYECFVKLEEQYRPRFLKLMDQYGLSRCLRQLQSYGLFTVDSYRNMPKHQDLVDSITFDLHNISARLNNAELHPSRRVPSETAHRVKSPPRHMLHKERHKSLKGIKALTGAPATPEKEQPGVLSPRLIPQRSTLSRSDGNDLDPPVPRWDSYRL